MCVHVYVRVACALLLINMVSPVCYLGWVLNSGYEQKQTRVFVFFADCHEEYAYHRK